MSDSVLAFERCHLAHALTLAAAAPMIFSPNLRRLAPVLEWLAHRRRRVCAAIQRRAASLDVGARTTDPPVPACLRIVLQEADRRRAEPNGGSVELRAGYCVALLPVARTRVLAAIAEGDEGECARSRAGAKEDGRHGRALTAGRAMMSTAAGVERGQQDRALEARDVTTRGPGRTPALAAPVTTTCTVVCLGSQTCGRSHVAQSRWRGRRSSCAVSEWLELDGA